MQRAANAIALLCLLALSAWELCDSCTHRHLLRAKEHTDVRSTPRLHSHDAHADAHEHAGQSSGSECGHSRVAHLQEESLLQFRAYAALEAARAARQGAGRRHLHADGGPKTIRITVEHQSQSQLSSAQQQAVQRLLGTAVQVVRKFVRITAPLQTPLMVRNNAVCAPATIGAALRAGGRTGSPSTDFYLLVTAQSSSSCSSSSSSSGGSKAAAGTLAWAMACDYSLDPASFGRPILGVINLCPGAVSAALAAATAADRTGLPISGGVVDIVVHELLHALGLSSSLYSNWKCPGGGWRGGGPVSSDDGVSYLTTPRASQEAQQVLGCSQLPGVPLEDQGSAKSATSHWEFRFFHQELMSPFFFSTAQRQRLSTITLGALQDTGWYEPRWQYAQPLDLQQLPGSSLGCNLAMQSCQKYQEQNPGAYYCRSGGAKGSSNSLNCYNPTTPAACDATPFSNDCALLHPAAISCSETGVASLLPVGAANLYSGVPGAPETSSGSFYRGLGAAYGPRSSCLTWTNSSAGRYAGCFQALRCDGSGVPVLSAVVKSALVSLPCPVGTTIFLKSYLPVKDASTAVQCPTPAQAAELCSPYPSSLCPVSGSPCFQGTCSSAGSCICDLEYVGADCSMHVSQVSDFDSLDGSYDDEAATITVVQGTPAKGQVQQSSRPPPRSGTRKSALFSSSPAAPKTAEKASGSRSGGSGSGGKNAAASLNALGASIDVIALERK